MNPFQTKTAIAALLFLLCAPFVKAEEQAASPARTCVVFTIQDLSGGSENKDYEQPITDSVSAAFGVGGYDIVPTEKWSAELSRKLLGPRALLSEATAVSVAQAVGARLAVTGYFTVQEEGIYVSVQCWDVNAGVLAAGLQQTARFNIAFYSSLYGKVTEMVPRIVLLDVPDKAATGAAPEKRQPAVSTLTFLSPDEGMEVYLPGDLRVGAISDGKLVWNPSGLALGTKLGLEKRKPGFHTSRETVNASREIRLSPLVVERKKTVEVDWTFGQLLGLGGTLRVYDHPDETFLFAGNYFFLQPPLNSAGNPVVHDDMSIGVGTYLFFPPDFPVRFGVSTGAGATFSFLTGPAAEAHADLYLDVLNYWVETRLLGPIIFLRQEWKFSTGGSSSLLGKQWMKIADIPPITLGVMFRW